MEAEEAANAKAQGEVQVSVLQEHTEGRHDWHIMGKNMSKMSLEMQAEANTSKALWANVRFWIVF